MTNYRTVLKNLPDGVTFDTWGSLTDVTWDDLRAAGYTIVDVMAVDAPDGWHWTWRPGVGGYHSHAIYMPEPRHATAQERWDMIAEDTAGGIERCDADTCPDPEVHA